MKVSSSYASSACHLTTNTHCVVHFGYYSHSSQFVFVHDLLCYKVAEVYFECGNYSHICAYVCITASTSYSICKSLMDIATDQFEYLLHEAL